MGMLAKIRRMYFRDHITLREIARQTSLSRNTIRWWLRQNEMRDPAYPARKASSILDPYKEQLAIWLRADSHRPKRDRRTDKVLFQLLQAQGFPGGYARVAIPCNPTRCCSKLMPGPLQSLVVSPDAASTTAGDGGGQGQSRQGTHRQFRFRVMTGHYLFEPEFCNRAAGWEKEIVEKNAQDPALNTGG